ncbi:MAG: glycyl-radical enzyme activating protein [Chloroflexota bacterium]
MTGRVFDIKRFSIHDGPGIRTTVFLKGCPLTCWWCHNPEGQALQAELILRPERCIGCGACLDVCKHGAVLRLEDRFSTDRERCTVCGACVEVCYAGARELVGREMTCSELMNEIERDAPFYDQSGGGVTFSGGEPLCQPDFLREILQACKQRSLHTALDTCGSVRWRILDEIRDYVDLFLYDLKLMDDKRHRAVTGVSNTPILSNLRALSQHGHAIILRIPIIPGINDDRENIEAIGAFAARLNSAPHVDLLPYHQIGRHKYHQLEKKCPLPQTDPPGDEPLANIAQQLREHRLEVSIE